MSFKSILFRDGDAPAQLGEGREVFFSDLKLNKVIDAITGKDEYTLKPFFHTSLKSKTAIVYRQEIMKEFENPVLFGYVKSFSDRMRKMRNESAKLDKLHYKYHKEGVFLNIVEEYCDNISSFFLNLSTIALKSEGLLGLRSYLVSYLHSQYFTTLVEGSKKLSDKLASVRYCVILKDLQVYVKNYEGEPDYTGDVEETFAKFRQGEVKDYRANYPFNADMNHIEAQILDGVATLFPDIFLELGNFFSQYISFPDKTITDFDREVQFYITYLGYISSIKQSGLEFCYPEITDKNKEIHGAGCYDIALAYKLTSEKAPVVTNDFYLNGKERIFIVSGPNQGGKTTFAYTFGQMHYLASIGCVVPGKSARLYLFDNLLTHFEKEENVENLRSKLEDDIIRIHEILNRATSSSILIMNEIFSSTTLQDAVFLSNKVIKKINSLDALCVWVTFIDELASFSDKTVSMVGTIVPDNPAFRTFKIERHPADGLAYALSIAEKYHLTYSGIKKRIQV